MVNLTINLMSESHHKYERRESTIFHISKVSKYYSGRKFPIDIDGGPSGLAVFIVSTSDF